MLLMPPPQPMPTSSATRGIVANRTYMPPEAGYPGGWVPQMLGQNEQAPVAAPQEGPMVNHNGQMVPLATYYQMMQGANINPSFWATMDSMYGTGYRTPQAPPPAPARGPSNTAPPMDPFKTFNQNPATMGNEKMGFTQALGQRGGVMEPNERLGGGGLPYTRGPNGPTEPSFNPGRQSFNPAFMGGRHLPVRRTLYNIQSNSQELPLMMGIMSAAGIDPQSAMGEFRSFLPRGGRLPATVF